MKRTGPSSDRKSRQRSRRSAGFSYVEVLVAVLVLVVSLPPAIEALRTGMTAGQVHESLLTLRGRLSSRMEEVLARPFSELAAAALAAGGGPTSYSDAPGSPERLVVLLSFYDGDDADADGDPFTGADPDLLWVRVEAEGTSYAFQSLVAQ